MRSLVCIEHDDFEGCLRDIILEGGKAGAGKSVSDLISTIFNPSHSRRLGSGQDTQQVCSARNVLAAKFHTKASMASWGFYN
jgi:hypothetical protein